MKPELKRIEAALQEAANHYAESRSHSESASPTSELKSGHGWHESTVTLLPGNRDRCKPVPSTPEIASDESPQALNLPEFAISSTSDGVALTNAALASQLLKDLQHQVDDWFANLTTTHHQLQAVYTEGPLVDGWLESFQPHSPNYAYRLCGVDQDGQMWCRSCPSDQVADVSLAIARYQRWKLLLDRKHYLENQLGRTTEWLIEVHSQAANLPIQPDKPQTRRIKLE